MRAVFDASLFTGTRYGSDRASVAMDDRCRPPADARSAPLVALTSAHVGDVPACADTTAAGAAHVPG
jgi:hypothetical protein